MLILDPSMAKKVNQTSKMQSCKFKTAISPQPLKLENPSFDTLKRSQFWEKISFETRFCGKKQNSFAVLHTCDTSGGLRPPKTPYWGQSPQTPTNFYCIFKRISLSWFLCQKMKSLAQKAAELERFKVWDQTVTLGDTSWTPSKKTWL